MAVGSDAFLWSIKNGDLDAVRSIVEKQGVDPMRELNGGRLPIHFAADYGQRDVLDFLLSLPLVNINAKDKHGISALLAAIYEGHVECVKLMLDRGASKNGVAPNGQSYLECAENDEIRQLLSS